MDVLPQRLEQLTHRRPPQGEPPKKTCPSGLRLIRFRQSAGSWTTMATPNPERLFPEPDCIAALGELSAWTSVQSILAAARHLEGRPGPADEVVPFLISPFDGDGQLEAIAIKAFGWLIAGFAPPAPKLALAAAQDPRIKAETIQDLAGRRFRPSISVAPAGKLAGAPPDKPCFLIQDDPVVIEMIQAPIICLMTRLHDSNELARSNARMLKEQEETTGGRSTIYHRNYGDSRLPAVLEALCFYCWGLDFGPVWGDVGGSGSDISYRAVNVHGVPPIDPRLIDAAKATMEAMLGSLR